MKVFNFSLTVLAALLAIVVGSNLLLVRHNETISRNLAIAQQLASSDQGKHKALDQLAKRVNQSAATDPALKALLQNLKINVTPDVAPTTPAVSN